MNTTLGYKPPEEGQYWLTVAETAGRLGVTEQAIRQKCGRWQAAGLARVEVINGKPCWRISPAADPALKPDPVPDFIPHAAALTGAQRAELMQRHEVYKRWREVCHKALHAPRQISQEAATATFLAALDYQGGQAVTHRTLRRWHKRSAKLGINALMDARWTRKPGKTRDERMIQEAIRFYLGSRKSMAECFRAAEQTALNQGWRVYKEGAVRKAIHRVPAAEVCFKREGPEACKNKFEPHLERDYSPLKSNEIWQSDHHRLDVICKIGEKLDTRTGKLVPQYGRPWLTTWIDIRSRKILAYIIRAEDPDSGVILKCFYHACMTHGVPWSVYIDNGKDYTCRDFYGETKADRRTRRMETPEAKAPDGGIYAALGVETANALTYNARAKLVERLHRTIKEQFCKDWECYTGGNPTEKPEELPDMMARGKAPEVADFAAAFGEWVELYHNTIHHGDAMDCTPNEAWNANLESKRTAPRETLDVLLLRRVGPVKIGRNGCQYHGLRYGQFDLGSRQGEQVYLRVDDGDLSKVSVWDLEDRFLLFAPANQRLPAKTDRTLLTAAIKRMRKHAKALHNAEPARLAMHEAIPAAMFALQRERAERLAKSRPSNPPPNPTMVPIRSAIEGEMKAYQTALERLKPGAAAERFSNLEWSAQVGETPEEHKVRRCKYIARLKARGVAIPSLYATDEAEADRMTGNIDIFAIFAAEKSDAEKAADREAFINELRVEAATRPSLLDICGGAA